MGFPIGARFAHPDAGYKGDRELAAKHLKPGSVYTVLRLEVGRSSSELYLDVDGLRGTGFNTVMFESAPLPRFDDEDAAAEDDGGPEEPQAAMSTVGDLLDYLAGQPRDRKVILEKDAEGNGYSPLASAGEGLYVADTTYSGEVHPVPEDVAAWVAAGHGREGDWGDWDDGSDGAERVIVLGPVN